MSKIESLSQVISRIPDGSHMTFSGFGHTLTPLAAVREIIKQQKKNLTVTGVAECWAVDMLIGAGALSRLNLSNFMFEGYGRCRNFSRAIENGKLPVEDYSHFALASRFAAGAVGATYAQVKSMLGSDILQTYQTEKKYESTTCPFTGENILLIPAVNPDIAIIHGHYADEDGNVQILGAKAVVEEQIRASKEVIVTVEKMVSRDFITKNPDMTTIPGLLVSSVIEVPFGAHPTGMYKMYDFDNEHIEEYMQASKAKETFNEYLRTYTEVDHYSYLNLIGLRKLFDIRADPYLGYKDPAVKEV